MIKYWYVWPVTYVNDGGNDGEINPLHIQKQKELLFVMRLKLLKYTRPFSSHSIIID